jgi:hypothetical protein
MQFAQSKAVIYGQLKNPRFDAKTDEGFTDLHATAILKDDPARDKQTVFLLRGYLPVIGDTPPDYLAFCNTTNGKLECTFGVPATNAVLDYMKAASKLEADSTVRLAFYFKHLASANAVIAADAFVEFARASDTDIARAAKHFDAATLRKLIADVNVPSERLGVFAYLLGVCGTATDATFLAELLKRDPLPERVRDSFGGLLAGHILLDPKNGWAFTTQLLADTKQPYSVRLSSINTVRFFQASQTNAKPHVLKCCEAILPDGDLADQAIEDLRRWGYWELNTTVFALYSKPSHSAPIVRRGIIRYALTCPHEDAKKFVVTVRQSDPKLVASIEEIQKMFETVPPKK